jgi:hypothetical protein
MVLHHAHVNVNILYYREVFRKIHHRLRINLLIGEIDESHVEIAQFERMYELVLFHLTLHCDVTEVQIPAGVRTQRKDE